VNGTEERFEGTRTRESGTFSEGGESQVNAVERFTTWYLAHIVHPVRNEEGASAVEYGILVGLIAAVILAIVGTLGDRIVDIFTSITDDPNLPPGP
jgi:pilus assembly protein Flp/PilA